MDRSCAPGSRRAARRAALASLAALVTLWASACDGITDSPEDPGTATDELVIAFIGDQGWEPSDRADGPRAVLELIRDEGAEAVMHQGDLDYGDDPAAWERMIDDILGPGFPYFVSVGNHDTGPWYKTGGYQDRLEARLRRIGVEWEGDLGVMAALSYRGVYMLFGAPGVFGSDPSVYAEFFADRLNADASVWSICSWHKNQRSMQVGGKSDETGWDVYERCREEGAIIATGHEHSYSRTHLLSEMASQRVASTSSTLVLSKGATFAFVSGLGGRSIRDQELDGDWWAAVYTSDQGANYGALFGVFNIGGDSSRAHFYFKDIDGLIVDDFQLVSEVE